MSWIRGFERLFQTREDGRALAILRIGMAWVCFWNVFSMQLHDVVGLVWANPVDGGLVPLFRGHFVFRWLGTEARSVWSVIAVHYMLCGLLVVGLGRSLPALGLTITLFALRSLNPPITAGYDALILNGTFFLVFSDCTRTWSLDCWLRHRTWSSREEVRAWPRYLFVFQLVIMYTATGFKKASFVWMPSGNYTALYYILMDPGWRRIPNVDFMQWGMLFTQLGTAFSWHWEHSAPVLLVAGYCRFTASRGGRLRNALNRFDLRWPWLAIGLCMHAGIWAAIQVGPFSLAAVTFYPALFGSRELERAWMSAHRFMTRIASAPSAFERWRRAEEPKSFPSDVHPPRPLETPIARPRSPQGRG